MYFLDNIYKCTAVPFPLLLHTLHRRSTNRRLSIINEHIVAFKLKPIINKDTFISVYMRILGVRDLVQQKVISLKLDLKMSVNYAGQFWLLFDIKQNVIDDDDLYR